MKPAVFKHEKFYLKGTSVAGIGTSFFLPTYNVCIDVAQGLHFTLKAKTYLITHGHMDHAAGIPYLISQKMMLTQTRPIFYMPKSLIGPLTEIMNIWEKIENHKFNYEFRAAEINFEYPLSPNTFFKSFNTFHRVDSQGYTIFEKRKKLKKEFSNKTERELIELKRLKTELTETLCLPIFSYTGDTKIEFWDSNPEVLNSKVLFMEVTYWDNQKTVEQARNWGHLHFDEVLPRLEQFRGEKLVFTHVSSRYSQKEIISILNKKIPTKLKTKIDFFPRTIQGSYALDKVLLGEEKKKSPPKQLV